MRRDFVRPISFEAVSSSKLKRANPSPYLTAFAKKLELRQFLVATWAEFFKVLEE